MKYLVSGLLAVLWAWIARAVGVPSFPLYLGCVLIGIIVALVWEARR